VSLGSILLVIAIQLTALLAPLAIGLAGAISGGVAGLASIALWALLGVPASYGVIDLARATAAMEKRRAALPTRATDSPLTT
jgi:hypothetical protein